MTLQVSSTPGASAPPMQLVKIGPDGDSLVEVGQETVMFRHEEKFYSPTIIAVTVSDKLGGEELQKRIDAINALQFERVGCKIGVNAIAVVNDSGEAEAFAQAAVKTNESSDLALILCSDSPEAMAAATAMSAVPVKLTRFVTPAPTQAALNRSVCVIAQLAI